MQSLSPLAFRFCSVRFSILVWNRNTRKTQAGMVLEFRGAGGSYRRGLVHVLRVLIPTEPVFARMVPACVDSKFDPKEADD